MSHQVSVTRLFLVTFKPSEKNTIRSPENHPTAPVDLGRILGTSRLVWNYWTHRTQRELGVSAGVPSGYVKIAIENHHWNSEFSHEKWWFSIVILNYQRVPWVPCAMASMVNPQLIKVQAQAPTFLSEDEEPKDWLLIMLGLIKVHDDEIQNVMLFGCWGNSDKNIKTRCSRNLRIVRGPMMVVALLLQVV